MVASGVAFDVPENTAFIKEQHRKESRIQGKAMEKNLEKKRKSSTKPGDIPKKGGSLFKSQESKPVKKPSAAELKAQQDAQLLNMLSMNLWRRINAGYTVQKRKPESLMRSSFKWEPEKIDALDKEFMHKKDAFSEYCEALARSAAMMPKEKKPVVKYVPRKLRTEIAAKAAAAKKAKGKAKDHKSKGGNKEPAAKDKQPKAK